MKHRYQNPWHNPHCTDYGPAFYETDKEPVEYRGFQIFQRIPGAWELVKDGVCLTQRAGKDGPRALADALMGNASDEPEWFVERAKEILDRFGIKIAEAA